MEPNLGPNKSIVNLFWYNESTIYLLYTVYVYLLYTYCIPEGCFMKCALVVYASKHLVKLGQGVSLSHSESLRTGWIQHSGTPGSPQIVTYLLLCLHLSIWHSGGWVYLDPCQLHFINLMGEREQDMPKMGERIWHSHLPSWSSHSILVPFLPSD